LQSQVYDRIEHVVAKIKRIDGVVGIILFGGYARGDYDEGSDVDLLAIFRDKNALRQGSKELYSAASESDLFLQIVSLTVDELKSSNLLESAKREGKIYLANDDVKKLLDELHKAYALITFSSAKLSRKDKVVFTQELEGRGKGKYTYEGWIQRLGGYKVGRGVMMIPVENLRAITQILEQKSVDYVIRYVWA